MDVENLPFESIPLLFVGYFLLKMVYLEDIFTHLHDIDYMILFANFVILLICQIWWAP